MIQLLLHVFGDYFTQNDWMAMNKKSWTLKGWFACAFHCVLYSLPFLFIASWQAVLVIGLTHFIIDKGSLVAKLISIKNWTWTKTGFHPDRPFAVVMFITFVIDNSIHIAINYYSILYL